MINGFDVNCVMICFKIVLLNIRINFEFEFFIKIIFKLILVK